MFAQGQKILQAHQQSSFPKEPTGTLYIHLCRPIPITIMPALLALAPSPEDAPEIQETPEHTESEHAEVSMEIPGRSVHPAKLTAMLRSNFGFGAYDIMV
jgi:hypothetical protein